ncbi:chloramphenicol O-acetyltransferase [Candidatus Vecturithrix granuli]|uniref:Chloramphenicol O-acetyltransferase n=1 Tax=Vecturithrix granuli TaxID=1499967 RepID=A0A081C2Q3_VECG1|nr:chloramphenicol O-acetyltransferase [Candidatus Vecturithrix granuli]
MRYIDLEHWPRRKHFEFFRILDYPHFNLTANVDISTLYSHCKSHQLSLFKTIVYVAATAANAVPEFRQRIRDGQVVEHEVVHPSVTVMSGEDLFSFCHIAYTPNFQDFLANLGQAIERVKNAPTLEESLERADDVLYMTSIPWIAFTGVTHPIHLHPVDSVPRIAWGKFFEEGDTRKMPLSVQAHHALVDGIHVARYFQHFQDLLDHLEQ